MKKLFLTICLTIILFTPASAACNGGTEYVIDGYTFCVSKISLNWWSAENWCQSNGMHLPTIYEVCPGWAGYDEDGIEGTFEDCTLKLSIGNKNCWTATSFNSQSAFTLKPTVPGHSVSAPYKTDTYRALCVY